MDARTTIAYAVTGQVIEWYPREGVPDGAATASVRRGYDSNDLAELLTPTVSLDSVNLTLSASSGYSQANRRLINLSSTTGLVTGRRYVIANASGQDEMVRVSKITSGTSAEAEYDLAYDYPTAATLKGFRHTFTVDPTFVADLNNINEREYSYRVLWSYLVGGIPKRFLTYFDVARAAPQTSLTVEDLCDRWPDLRYQSSRGQDGQEWSRFIDDGFRLVRADLEAGGVDANRLAEGQMLDEIHRAATMMLIAQSGFTPGGRDAETWVRERCRQYLTDRDRLIAGAKLRMSERDGSMSPEGRRPVMFRS